MHGLGGRGGGGGGGGGFVRAEFLCVFVLGWRRDPGWGWLAVGGEVALNPRCLALLAVLRRWSRCWPCSLVVCGLFCKAVCSVSCLVPFCSCVFSPFSIAIVSLGGKESWSWCFPYV